jgi:hypothetical protein
MICSHGAERRLRGSYCMYSSWQLFFVHWLHTDNRSIAQPIEAVLLALAIFVASGRLVPKIWQRQHPTLSDSFLIASILNTIALFITDFLTYKLGGMEEYDPTAPEPSISQAIALKKVRWPSEYMETQCSRTPH